MAGIARLAELWACLGAALAVCAASVEPCSAILCTHADTKSCMVDSLVALVVLSRFGAAPALIMAPVEPVSVMLYTCRP